MSSKAMEIVSDRDARGGSANEYRVRHAKTKRGRETPGMQAYLE